MSQTPDDLIRQALRNGMRPEPRLTVSEWADQYRILPPTSSEPGHWRTSRTPYLREIMNSLSSGNGIETVVFMAGAQLGKTESGMNWIGYIIHHAPGLALLVMPTTEMAKRNTGTRIDPLIESCPILRERVVAQRSRESGNSLFRKRFPGGELVMTGANSPTGLRSTPARYLFLDEVDGYPVAVGDSEQKEGDPLSLAIQRTVTFRGKRKIYVCSTPGSSQSSRIEKLYQETDQRRYFVPCFGCGEYDYIRFENIRWPNNPHNPEKAALVCPKCGFVHDEVKKQALLDAGEWRPLVKGAPGRVGYHLPSLYSPWLTWAEIARTFLEVKSDPVRLQAFTNTILAETWDDLANDAINIEVVLDRRERFGPNLPEGIAVLTAGVDNQPDRLEVTLVGWGADEQSWVVDHKVIWGDITTDDPWNDLDKYLSKTWCHERVIADLPIYATCVDTGGTATLSVYKWISDKSKRRIFGTKGRSTNDGPFWPKQPSRNNKGKIPLYLLNSSAGKDVVYRRINGADAGGRIHLSDSLPDNYYDGLVSEVRRTVYVKGFPKYEWNLLTGKRNEPLDCYVLAFAALHGLYSMGFDLAKAAREVAAAPLRVSQGGSDLVAAVTTVRQPRSFGAAGRAFRG